MIKKDIEITTKIQGQKTFEKPDEPYQYILAFLETDGIWIFDSKNYKVFVSIGILPLRMRPIVSTFDTDAGLDVTRADVLDRSSLAKIRQRNMPEIQSASDTKLVVTGIITLHRLMG